jgi:hypothetical protein
VSRPHGCCRTVRLWTSAGGLAGLAVGLLFDLLVPLWVGSPLGAFYLLVPAVFGMLVGFLGGAATGTVLATLAATPVLAPAAPHRACTAGVVAAGTSGVAGLLIPTPLLLLLFSGGRVDVALRSVAVLVGRPVLLAGWAPFAAAGMVIAVVAGRRLPPGRP